MNVLRVPCLLAALFLLVILSGTVRAQCNTYEDCANSKVCTCSDPNCCDCGGSRWCNRELGDPLTLLRGDCQPCGFTAGGWLQGGYHSNPTRLSMDYGDLLSFNDVPNQFNLQQAWVWAERAANRESCCWDWGFRTDFLYGTDAQKTQAFGQPTGWDTGWDNGVYGWALPQAYFEVANSEWSVKLGHFFTLIGYEVVAAPDNFFYSHALTMYNSEPFTHTGILASYSPTDDTTIYGGWTLGWDTGFEQFQGGSNFLGGISFSLCDDVTLAYMLSTGNFGWKGDNAYMHSLVFDWSISDKLNYVLQSDYLVGDNIPVFGKNIFAQAVFDHAETIGINQYLFYELGDRVKLGGRVEWWRAAGIDFYELTLGVNAKPRANFIVRPEIRYDWSPVANNIIAYNEWVFGIDCIFTF